MSSHTSRMVALLGAFRRERNGLVADTMHYDGVRYGLNYGVSLPTIRSLVREEAADHDFARFLFAQQVRELQLAALHLADPQRLNDSDEARYWLSGLRNSELAEEAAFALLCRVEALPCILQQSLQTPATMWHYALWMAAARSSQPDCEMIAQTLATLRDVAADTAAEPHLLRLLVRAAVCRWEQAVRRGDCTQNEATEALQALGHSAWEEELREEVAWRIEG